MADFEGSLWGVVCLFVLLSQRGKLQLQEPKPYLCFVSIYYLRERVIRGGLPEGLSCHLYALWVNLDANLAGLEDAQWLAQLSWCVSLWGCFSEMLTRGSVDQGTKLHSCWWWKISSVCYGAEENKNRSWSNWLLAWSWDSYLLNAGHEGLRFQTLGVKPGAPYNSGLYPKTGLFLGSPESPDGKHISWDITSLLQEFHLIRNPVMHLYISSSLYIIISVPF